MEKTKAMAACSGYAAFCNPKGILGLTPLNLFIDGLIWILVALPLPLMYLYIEPTKKGFFCNDQSLRYPYKPDTVSTNFLYLASCLIPLLLVSVTEWLNWQILNKSIGKGTQLSTTVRVYTIFLFGITLNQFFVDIPKYFMGSMRPNFFAVCRPNVNCSKDEFVFNYTCTNTEFSARQKKDALLSFPSGHAAISVYTALYTVLYLELRFEVKVSRFFKASLQMALLVISAWSVITRVSDNKHHLLDVIVGSAIGTMVASGVFLKITCPSLRQQQVKMVGKVMEKKEKDQYECTSLTMA
ncbi:phospholipid phosphatase 1-like [Argonauta hians]